MIKILCMIGLITASCKADIKYLCRANDSVFIVPNQPNRLTNADMYLKDNGEWEKFWYYSDKPCKDLTTKSD